MIEVNPAILEEAHKLTSGADVHLPAEIPGFPTIYVAAANDLSVQAMAGFVSNGRSFKIGTKSS